MFYTEESKNSVFSLYLSLGKIVSRTSDYDLKEEQRHPSVSQVKTTQEENIEEHIIVR